MARAAASRTSVSAIVACPTCKAPVPWVAEQPFKPFCSQRCKLIDLGDWATEAPWLMIISSAQLTTQYYFSSTPLNAPPNASLVVVNATVTNIGSLTLTTGANLFKIMDSSGMSYPPLQFTTTVANQFPWHPQTLAPGETASGMILYIVPDTASELDVVTFVNGKYLAWVLSW